MKQIFEFQWRNVINKNKDHWGEGNKLRTYNTFKHDFVTENYLNYENIFSRRSLITKMRISAHKLEIEQGRYKKHQSGQNHVTERLCTNCTLHAIENEEHVLMVCPKYNDMRGTASGKFNDIFHNWQDLSTNEKFLVIMTCNDFETTSLLSNMLVQIKQVRGAL
jgi:hypothetical protein